MLNEFMGKGKGWCCEVSVVSAVDEKELLMSV